MAISANFTADTDIIQRLDDNPNESDLDAAGLKQAFDTGAGNVVKAINSSLIPAINNELQTTNSSVSTIETNIGTISNLNTTATNLVGAVNEILGNVLYEANDTFSVSNYITGGLISGSKSSIGFNVVLPKSMKNITSVSITSAGARIRVSDGGYVDDKSSSNGIDRTDYTWTASKISDDRIYVNIVRKNGTAFTNVTNNTPVSIQLDTFGITLS